MPIDPFYISVGELFERKYVFKVPRYQRGFAWEEAEMDDFLRDITQCYNARVDNQEKAHFFGSMISVKREVSGSSGRHRTVIDGQQRLATFVLLARCLESQFRELNAEAEEAKETAIAELATRKADELRDTYRILHDEIHRQPTEITRLALSDPDKTFFSNLIDGNKPETATRFSHELLKEAYSRILADISITYAEQESLDAKLDCLSIIKEVMQRDAALISIETDDDTEAYRIFQVVNNRGTRLTEGDLMRAATAEILGKPAFRVEFDKTAQHWDEILTAKPPQIEDFLRWYYASTMGDRPSKAALFEDFMSAVFPEREKASLSKADATRVAKNAETLASEFWTCDAIISAQWPFGSARVPRWDRHRLQLLIEVLDHTLCMPLLMAAVRLGQKQFSDVIFLVERFAFRCKIICQVHTGSLQKVYHEHALKIRESPSTYKTNELKTAFRNVVEAKASDKHFESSLIEQLSYQPNASNKYLKYFLATIEEFLPWYNKGATGKLQVREKTRIIDLAELTIEHVYPQKPDPKTFDKSLEPLVNSLGNLTLLGPDDNDAVGNKGFVDKRAAYKNSTLKMNQEIGALKSWKAITVKGRAKRTCQIAQSIFTF